MLSKLRHALAKLHQKIAGKEKALEVAQHRWLMNHVRAVANHRAGEKSKRWAKFYNSYGPHEDTAKATRLGRAGRRQSVRAKRAHDRATWWVGRAKELTTEIHDLKVTEERVTKEIREVGVQVNLKMNEVTGGTPKQRVGVSMHVSAAKAREYYSMSGRWTVEYCLTGPPDGCRYDCSSWFLSVYRCSRLPDPTGAGYASGWTGTLGEHGKVISEAMLDTGDAILFGYAPFHHVEMKDGPMSKSPWTIGHGSTAVDPGSVTLLPGPRAFRRYL